MPPKAKITKDMIVDAAFAIARETGAENINARTVSDKLNCSTQPVMYHFSTIGELKKAAYAKADQYHTNCLMNIGDPQENIALEIGLNYIRFAVREPNLFRFLFQSGYAEGNSLLEMMDSEALTPILSAMQGAAGIGTEQMKAAFLIICMFAHGYASIIANNSLVYDEEVIKEHLTLAYRGAISAAREKLK